METPPDSKASFLFSLTLSSVYPKQRDFSDKIVVLLI